MKTRELTESEVTFTVFCEAEDIPYEGNAMASGDDAIDQETNDWIRSELDSGNQWAWCYVRVVATWKGFEGQDTLCGCSYRSEEDFREPGCYFDDMKAAALADLNTNIRLSAEEIAELAS